MIKNKACQQQYELIKHFFQLIGRINKLESNEAKAYYCERFSVDLGLYKVDFIHEEEN
jgi:hypothetical protein